MAAKPPLVSRWGGTPPAHDRLVLDPANQTSDLVLRSEVIEQSFFSLQRHEYHYKAENTFDVGGAYCTMKVKWNGPKVEFERLGPGPYAVMNQSWFSAQTLKTSATADVLAGLAKPYVGECPGGITRSGGARAGTR